MTTYAVEITSNSTAFLNESIISSKVLDNKESAFIKILSGDTIKILSNETIYGLYIVYEVESEKGILETNGEKTDIMLFSSHTYDEQLFFLGILPTYVEDVLMFKLYILLTMEMRPLGIMNNCMDYILLA